MDSMMVMTTWTGIAAPDEGEAVVYALTRGGLNDGMIDRKDYPQSAL